MKQTIQIQQAAIVGNTLSLALAPAEISKARAVLQESTDKNKPLAAVLGVVTQKRSQSANAYFWTLCEQLSKAINSPILDIYRDCIRDIGGVSALVTIREDAADTYCRAWRSKGAGWMVDKIDTKVTPDDTYVTLQCWYGSSCYDSSQMAHLIDSIVQECEQQGIPTMTPDELARLEGLSNA